MTTLSAEQRRAWTEDGYVVVPGLLRDRVAELAEAADAVARRGDLIDAQNLRCRWADHVETGECRIDCLDPVVDLSPAFAAVAHDERLVEVVA